MKHFFLYFSLFCCMLPIWLSCSVKRSPVSVTAQTVDVMDKANNESVEVQKLRAVLDVASLPLAIHNAILARPESFLRDLNMVLQSDTNALLLLVDKSHFLSDTYIPQDLIPLTKNDVYQISRNDLSLRLCAYDALLQMAQASRLDGITLLASSTYRSYVYQENLYERNVLQLGKAAADRESARPGSSQHQLGTVVDFGSITDAFADTKAGKWMLANAYRFGFSLSFPDGYEDITGYRWESWHYRYVGVSATLFQRTWFADIQQYMLEFIYAWNYV